MQVTKQETDQVVRKRALVKWYSKRLGYGFLTVEEEPELEDIFVRHLEIHAAGYQVLLPGQVVDFEVAYKDDGKMYAVNLKIMSILDSYRGAPREAGTLTFFHFNSHYGFVRTRRYPNETDLYVPSYVCAKAGLNAEHINRPVRFIRAHKLDRTPLAVWVELK